MEDLLQTENVYADASAYIITQTIQCQKVREEELLVFNVRLSKIFIFWKCVSILDTDLNISSY